MTVTEKMDPKDYSFKHPFTCMIAGPTSCGKTVFVRQVLEYRQRLLKDLPPDARIIWAYGQWQETYSKPIVDCEVEYVDGLPDDESIAMNPPDLIIIDDLMNELGNNQRLANMFTKGSHHLKMSIIFIVQNIFHQAKQMRNISLNCHYFVLMKNPRDKSQIHSLARQLYPNKMKFLIESYEDATKEPYSYLRIDLTPSTPERFRLTTKLFPENSESDPLVVVYSMR